MTTFSIIRRGVATTFPRDNAQLEASPDALAWVVGEEGTGAARPARETQQGPLQHGATDRGFRLTPRRVTLLLAFEAVDLADMERRRDELITLTAPSETPLALEWQLSGGGVRRLDAHLVDDLGFRSSDRLGLTQRIAAVFEAADPTFYDPGGVSVSFGIAASDDAFNVPLAVPWAIGSSVVDETVTIPYAGSWRTSPIITIQGPITDPVITNLTTGQVIDLTGTTIIGGDRYVLDTRYARGTVVDAAGVNRIAALSDTSDLVTFVLASRADAPSGNAVRVTGTAATGSTQVFLSYHTRYAGI
jgi:hypothetical protein